MLDISRSKDNQTMKIGQLIAYKNRNIFLEKLRAAHGRKTSTRPFFNKSKLGITLDQQSEVCSDSMSKSRNTKEYWNLFAFSLPCLFI